MIGSLFCNIFQNQRIVDLLFEKKNSKKKLKDLEELQVIFMQDQQFFQKIILKIKIGTIVAIFWNWVFRVLRVMVYELLRTALVPGQGLVAVFLKIMMPTCPTMVGYLSARTNQRGDRN